MVCTDSLATSPEAVQLPPTPVPEVRGMTGSEPGDVSAIRPFIYLCGAEGVTEANSRKFGITAIINITISQTQPGWWKGDYLRIILEDTDSAQLHHWFDIASCFIEDQRLKGGRVLVHCMAGISRSVSIIIAYLMKYERMSLHDAYEAIHDQRPAVLPNPGFWKQLVSYEEKLFGRTTCTLATRPKDLVDLACVPPFHESAMYPQIVWDYVRIALRNRKSQIASQQAEPVKLADPQSEGGSMEQDNSVIDDKLPSLAFKHDPSNKKRKNSNCCKIL